MKVYVTPNTEEEAKKRSRNEYLRLVPNPSKDNVSTHAWGWAEDDNGWYLVKPEING